MMGTYNPNDGRFPQASELTLENGMYPDVGVPPWVGNGPPGSTRPPVRIAQITDGTSNTIGFGEIAHGKLSQFSCGVAGGCDWECANWWADADYGSATMTGFYPPNFPIPQSYYTTGLFMSPDGCDPGNIPTFSGLSFHPGGINAAFVDGSVHFLKSSISSWNSLAIKRIQVATASTNPAANCTIPAGTRPGVYQALCTINGGEIVSSDQY
jgi:prepilin-type processing-associated H-X9-DG protein